MLASSYRPTQALVAQTQPSLNLADIATVAGRQLGGYGSELGRASLDYDLGSEGAAANLRNQLLQGWFGMLTQSGVQQQQSPITYNNGGSNSDSIDESYLDEIGRASVRARGETLVVAVA